MGKTLAEILADAASNDDVQFTGPDGLIVKLGDIRGFRTGVSKEETALKAKQAEAERVATEAKKLLEELDKVMKAEQEKNKKPNEVKEPDWKKNPLYEDLVPVFDGLTAKLEAATNTAAAAQKSLTQISAFYSIERLRNEYDRAPENWKKANKFEEVVAAALAAGEVESFGQGENVVKMPTLRKRIHEGTEADRIKAAVDAAVASNTVELEKKFKASQVSKPQGRFATKTSPSDKPPIAKLEELTSEKIMDDPDIAKAMQGEVA